MLWLWLFGHLAAKLIIKLDCEMHMSVVLHEATEFRTEDHCSKYVSN